MTDKEFRRLNRMELIDMIRLLRESEAQLKSENDALREQLADRRTRLDNAGSIAEAILSLSGIAETAQTAADDYLAEIRAMHAEAERKLADAEAKADNLIKSALRRATEIIADAARRSAPPEDADEIAEEDEEAEIEVEITVTEDVPADAAEPPSDEPDEIEEHADES
ncbi:MAG: hypothetical protein J6C52_08200 [Clostridia bacterium]|nr:hypothetical protein [Clostridia bacterium]